MTKLFIRAIFAAALGLGLCARPSLAQVYTVTDLGVLPNNPPLVAVASYATGVNNEGHVVGYVHLANAFGQYDRAFIWKNGQIVDLGTLSGLVGTTTSTFATAINNNGQVVGCVRTCGEGANGFLWRDGVMTEPWAGQVPFGHIFAPAAISDAGEVVGTANYVAGPGRNVHLLSWRSGVASQIFFCGPLQCYLNGVNNLGEVVGRALDGFLNQTTLWKSDGSGMNIGTLPGAVGATARAINDSSQVVGDSSFGNGSTRAFLWFGGAVTDLGTLGGTNSTAAAINSQGQVVGSSEIVPGVGLRHAFLHSNGVITDLNNVLLDGAGWELASATGINDNGQIVGHGTHLGETRAFLLTPVLAGVGPSHAGNIGTTNLAIASFGILPGATVRLSLSGSPDIVGSSVAVTRYPTTSILQATFDLRGAPPGVYDVVVTQADGTTVVLPRSFTVVQGGEAQMWVDVIGRAVIRGGVPQSYTVLFGNRGAGEELFPAFWIAIPTFVSWRVVSDVQPRSVDIVDDQIVLTFRPPKSGSGAVSAITLVLTAPDDPAFGHRVFPIRSWTVR